METRASRRSGAVAAAAEAEWTAMLAELAEWKEENGGSMASLTDEDGGSKKRGSKKPKISKLGRWVAEMRKEKKEGRLSKDKEDKLNEIGFEWGKEGEEGGGADTTGASKIATAEGESSTDNVADGEGEAKNQKKRRRNPSRNAKKLHNDFIEEAFFQGELTQEDGETAKSQGGDADGANRKAKKRKVGDQQWEQKFEELVRFKAQYGHFRIPVKEMPLLKYWAQNQKITYRKGKLSEERRVRLESVGFHWGKQRKGDTPQKGSDRGVAAKTPSAAHGRLTSASGGKPHAGGEGEAEGDGSSGDEDEEYEDEDEEQQEVATTDTSAASSKKKAAKEGNVTTSASASSSFISSSSTATTPSNGASNAAARGAVAHPSPMYGQPKPSIHTTVATHSTPSYTHPPTTSQFGSGKDHRMVLSLPLSLCVCYYARVCG